MLNDYKDLSQSIPDMPSNATHTMPKDPLKKCSDCGLNAWTEEDLKLFRTNKSNSLGKQNLCKSCYSVRYNLDGHKRRLQKEKLFKEGLKTCRGCGKLLPLNNFLDEPDGLGGKGTICKICRVEVSKKWRLENLDKARKSRRKSKKKYGVIERQKALVYLSGDPPECGRCGFSDIRTLQIDHINNDAFQERKKYKSRIRNSTHVLRLPREEALINYQVLCANCNRIKYIEYLARGDK